MSERADFYVEKVHFTKDHNHIMRVLVRQDSESKLSKPADMARKQILSNIQSGKRFMTIFRNENGKYRRGQRITSVHVNGEEFLRTDRNVINQDHLEGLPEF
jgi:hypothetical protein